MRFFARDLYYFVENVSYKIYNNYIVISMYISEPNDVTIQNRGKRKEEIKKLNFGVVSRVKCESHNQSLSRYFRNFWNLI